MVGLLLSLGMAPRWDVVSTDLPMLMSIRLHLHIWPEVPHLPADACESVDVPSSQVNLGEQASLLDCTLRHGSNRLSLFKETHVAGRMASSPERLQGVHMCKIGSTGVTTYLHVGCAAAGGRHPSQFNASA